MTNNVLEIDLILNQRNYSRIYNGVFVILIILMTIGYLSLTLKYQTYYYNLGKNTKNGLELLVNIDDLKYIQDNNIISIDDKKYTYKIISINDELYVTNDYLNYQYVYLYVDNLKNIPNYVYHIKIEKDNKAIAKYLKDLL